MDKVNEPGGEPERLTNAQFNMAVELLKLHGPVPLGGHYGYVLDILSSVYANQAFTFPEGASAEDRDLILDMLTQYTRTVFYLGRESRSLQIYDWQEIVQPSRFDEVKRSVRALWRALRGVRNGKWS